MPPTMMPRVDRPARPLEPPMDADYQLPRVLPQKMPGESPVQFTMRVLQAQRNLANQQELEQAIRRGPDQAPAIMALMKLLSRKGQPAAAPSPDVDPDLSGPPFVPRSAATDLGGSPMTVEQMAAGRWRTSSDAARAEGPGGPLPGIAAIARPNPFLDAQEPPIAGGDAQPGNPFPVAPYARPTTVSPGTEAWAQRIEEEERAKAGRLPEVIRLRERIKENLANARELSPDRGKQPLPFEVRRSAMGFPLKPGENRERALAALTNNYQTIGDQGDLASDMVGGRRQFVDPRKQLQPVPLAELIAMQQRVRQMSAAAAAAVGDRGEPIISYQPGVMDEPRKLLISHGKDRGALYKRGYTPEQVETMLGPIPTVRGGADIGKGRRLPSEIIKVLTNQGIDISSDQKEIMAAGPGGVDEEDVRRAKNYQAYQDRVSAKARQYEDYKQRKVEQKQLRRMGVPPNTIAALQAMRSSGEKADVSGPPPPALAVLNPRLYDQMTKAHESRLSRETEEQKLGMLESDQASLQESRKSENTLRTAQGELAKSDAAKTKAEAEYATGTPQREKLAAIKAGLVDKDGNPDMVATLDAMSAHPEFKDQLSLSIGGNDALLKKMMDYEKIGRGPGNVGSWFSSRLETSEEYQLRRARINAIRGILQSRGALPEERGGQYRFPLMESDPKRQGARLPKLQGGF